MADVAIVNATVGSAPTDYTVPGTQELVVKAVRAAIDGSGAGSSFLPALQLLDGAGHVMWTAVNTSSPVAAGGSADVSWFPRVGGGGGTSTQAQWFFVSRSTSYTVTAGATQTVPWTTLKTSDSSLFSLSTVHGHTNDTIVVARGGIVLWTMFSEADALDPSYAVNIFNNFDNATNMGSANANQLNQELTKGLPGTTSFAAPRDYAVVVPTSVPFNLYTEVTNFDVSNRNLLYMEAGGIFFPSGALFA